MTSFALPVSGIHWNALLTGAVTTIVKSSGTPPGTSFAIAKSDSVSTETGERRRGEKERPTPNDALQQTGGRGPPLNANC